MYFIAVTRFRHPYVVIDPSSSSVGRGDVIDTQERELMLQRRVEETQLFVDLYETDYLLISFCSSYATSSD